MNLTQNNSIVSVNDCCDYVLNNDILTTTGSILLLSESASENQMLSFTFNNVDKTCILQSETSNIIYTSSFGIAEKVNVIFQNNDFQIHDIKRLQLDSEKKSLIDFDLLRLGLNLDINPSKYYSLEINNNFIESITNDYTNELLIGETHKPTIVKNLTPNINFQGSTSYTQQATQYLVSENIQSITDVFQCDSSTWKDWTIFISFKLNDISSYEQLIFDIYQNNPKYALYALYASQTSIGFLTYSDNRATSNGWVLGNADTNKHIIEISSYNGKINASFDNNQVITNGDDVHPKTIGGLIIGSYYSVNDCMFREQTNTSLYRFLIFNRKLSSTEKQLVASKLI